MSIVALSLSFIAWTLSRVPASLSSFSAFLFSSNRFRAAFRWAILLEEQYLSALRAYN